MQPPENASGLLVDWFMFDLIRSISDVSLLEQRIEGYRPNKGIEGYKPRQGTQQLAKTWNT
jgi:hypothetical protein